MMCVLLCALLVECSLPHTTHVMTTPHTRAPAHRVAQVLAQQFMRRTEVHWHSGVESSESHRTTDAQTRRRRSTKGSAGRDTSLQSGSLRHLSSVEEGARMEQEGTPRLRA